MKQSDVIVKQLIMGLMVAAVLPVTACAKDKAEQAVQTTATTPTIPTATTSTAVADQQNNEQTIKPSADSDVATEIPASVSSKDEKPTVSTNDNLVAKFVSGVDYVTLVPPKPTSSAIDTVEVTEIFMYSCPHCYSFEPFIQKWIANDKPADVAFVRIPANFNEMAIVHTRAYYALQAMGVLDEALHEAIFDEYHRNQNKLKDKQTFANFVAKKGVDKKVFLETYDSFGVNASFRKAEELAQSYQANSVPMIVVNGRYVITGRMANTEQKFADTMNYLVELEQQRLAMIAVEAGSATQ